MQQNLNIISDHIHDMTEVLIMACKTQNKDLVLQSLGYLKQCLDFLIHRAMQSELERLKSPSKEPESPEKNDDTHDSKDEIQIEKKPDVGKELVDL